MKGCERGVSGTVFAVGPVLSKDGRILPAGPSWKGRIGKVAFGNKTV